jgi:uncharacterized repeat protein (TIGR01451 family)
VSIVVELDPPIAVAGRVTELRITATNNGPAVARNVSVLAEAPRGARFVGGTTSQGSCVGSVNLVCSLGTLEPAGAAPQAGFSALAVGESALVVQRVRLQRVGAAQARITLQSSAADPNRGNNRRVVDLAVLTQAPEGEPPTPPPPADDDGRPNANETVVVQELEGNVRVRLPGSDDFVDMSLLALAELPNGTIVDAEHGRFLLVAAASGGRVDLLEVDGGAATIEQRPETDGAARSPAQQAEPGVTELALALGSFGAPCQVPRPPDGGGPRSPQGRAVAGGELRPRPQAKPRKLVRRLWGRGQGRFRTRGRYAAATVRGTTWVTEDYCNGTLVEVFEGSLTLRDLVAGRMVVVREGSSYFVEGPPNGGADAGARG